MKPKTPVILLRAELALAALAAVSTLFFAVVAIRGENYFMLAAEGLILVAGVFGVLAGLGRFANGPALAAASVGGAVFTGVVVGGLETNVLPGFRGGESVHYAAFFSRFALAGLLGVVASLIIISRTPARSLRLLVTGGVVVSPLVALVVAGRVGLIARVQGAIPEVAFQIATLAAGLVGIALFSVAIHCVVRAFEVGVQAAEDASSEKTLPSA